MNGKSILVGTSKGLLVYRKSEGIWKVDKIHFMGFPVSMIYVDSRDGNWWIALNHNHWGPKLHRSQDQGKNWVTCRLPSFQNASGTKDSNTLKKIWKITARDPNKPGEYWIGTEPAALFSSNGVDYQICEPLWNHSSRVLDNMWFGTGGDQAFLHSILVNPQDINDIIVGVSSGGVFRSENGGMDWTMSNIGLQAAYLPNPSSPSGHDPHLILQHPVSPNILWQQNHCGIYRSKNRAKSWEMVSNPNTHPHYGFCIAIDEKDPAKAWVIPAQNDEQRVAPDLALQVYSTDNGGNIWMSKSNGLQNQNAFDLVLRNAFDKSEELFAFGSNNGNLYVSENSLESWELVSPNLAKILQVLIV